MVLEVRRLRPTDDRSDFRCGNIDLDRFFQRFAGQNQPASPEIVGRVRHRGAQVYEQGGVRPARFECLSYFRPRDGFSTAGEWSDLRHRSSVHGNAQSLAALHAA